MRYALVYEDSPEGLRLIGEEMSECQNAQFAVSGALGTVNWDCESLLRIAGSTQQAKPGSARKLLKCNTL